MLVVELIFWGGLGLIFGSFANVLILRRGTGKSIEGRSACVSCNETLHWYDLLPVISYLALKGSCRRCGSRISIQYPLVEVLASAGFIAVGLAAVPLLVKIVGCTVVIFMLAVAVYDTYHTIIPDAWVYALCALAFVYIFLTVPITGASSYLFALAAGPLAALPLLILWGLSSGAWMGFGDVKLAVAIGWMLGIEHGIQAVLLAFILGALIGIVLLYLPRILSVFHMTSRSQRAYVSVGYTIKSEVPFGPFLIISFFSLWIAELYVVALPLPPVFLL